MAEQGKSSSQAGLGAFAGGEAKSYPSVPAPGQPGSRFKPKTREREAQPQREMAPDGIIEVPDHIKARPKRELPIPTQGKGRSGLDTAEMSSNAYDPNMDMSSNLQAGTGGASAGAQADGSAVGMGVTGKEAQASAAAAEESRDLTGGLMQGMGLGVGDQSGQQAAAEAGTQESVVSASTKGFTQGFTGGMQRGMMGKSAGKGEADAESGKAEVFEPRKGKIPADEVEGLRAQVQGRHEKFPELKDMVMPEGAAARFPELAPKATPEAPESPDAEGELGR